jgi:two-component system CheB/CheR fusion protein
VTLRYPCHSATEQRWFLLHAAPIRWPGGGAVVSHVNITEFMTERQVENTREGE